MGQSERKEEQKASREIKSWPSEAVADIVELDFPVELDTALEFMQSLESNNPVATANATEEYHTEGKVGKMDLSLMMEEAGADFVPQTLDDLVDLVDIKEEAVFGDSHDIQHFQTFA